MMEGSLTAPSTASTSSIYDTGGSEAAAASIFDAGVAGTATGDYEKLRKKLGAITCGIVTACLMLTFYVLDLSYKGDGSSVHSGGTYGKEGLGSDIGQFSALDARGNQSTASIKICTRNQAFLIWINGHLVGTGQDCDLDFLRDRNDPNKQLQFSAPCDQPLLIAIEGQDFEMGDDEMSKAGIVAEITWCGTRILTGDRWNCSTSAPNKWMQPLGCDDGCADTKGGCGMCTTAGTRWGAPCALNDERCDQDGAFSQATLEAHTRGEAHCRPCCQQPDTVPGGCRSGDDMDACCGGHVSDDLQATQEQISTNAKWIWSGDFVDVDTAYCRTEFSCEGHGCKAPDTVEGCLGPGPHPTQPGYKFADPGNLGTPWRDASILDTTGDDKLNYYTREELGVITCDSDNGFNPSPRSPTLKDKSLAEGAVGCDTPGVDSWKFEGCCADFLWSIPSNNYAVAVGAAILMTYMFIGFHILCDDFFVPALNVLCEKFGLPDDIAGATFMAAGASSPELFASMIGVLTHSAVGVGTVVGSELFNLLCIIGAVCLVTPRPLQMDWRPLSREVVFFAISLIMLLWVLNDEKVETREASMLLAGYLAYVIVCSIFKRLMKVFCPNSGVGGDSKGAMDSEFYIDFYADDSTAEGSFTTDGDGSEGGLIGSGPPSPAPGSPAPGSPAPGGANGRGSGALSEPMLAADPGVNRLVPGSAFGQEYEEALAHGFLYKKSSFHSKARLSAGVWQKRWMVLDDTSFRYTRKNGKTRVLCGKPSDWAEARIVTTSYTEFELHTPSCEVARHTFKAVKPLVARQWIRQLNAQVDKYKAMSPAERGDDAAGGDHEEEHEHDITHPPEGGGPALWFFYLVFPLLFCFKYTVPDVRKKKYTEYYPATMIIAVIWLAFLAEFMMNSAETMGCILGIPEDIMGLTLTAGGTSLPNMFSSMIVAKQGLGTMSVSNAFGSNTFNIFIALALPWFVGSILNGSDTGNWYYYVPKGHIFASCEMLGAVLVFIVICFMGTNFRIIHALGWPFMVTYLVLITYLCVQ